tara:strand:+ start:68 stop:544 length:477 start_codon:yes stop_codon:yes gene_type:complete
MARAGHKLRPGFASLRVNKNDTMRTSKTIRRSRDVVLNVAQAAFIKVTQQVKDESQSIVPQKTGKLRRSAYKFVNRRAFTVDAEVGYDREGQVEYAYERHQVRARRGGYTTPGTDYLYLLRAFDKYSDDIVDIIAAATRKRFTVSSGFGGRQDWEEPG